MMRDPALATQVRRLGEHLSGDPNVEDKWAAYMYNTARTLEQRKYEEYLRTQEGMKRGEDEETHIITTRTYTTGKKNKQEHKKGRPGTQEEDGHNNHQI